jgi:small subunit ribosomal protein S16
MAVKIRLKRKGSKKSPVYDVIAADESAPRDGKFLEILGSYRPMMDKASPDRVKLVSERITYWLSVGAQPTERVAKFLEQAGLTTKKAA